MALFNMDIKLQKSKLKNHVDTSNIAQLLNQWGIMYHKTLSNYDISGSPDRSLFRTVVEDNYGNRFILEMMSKEKKDHKLYISKIIQALYDAQVPHILPYIKTIDNDFFVTKNESYWQLRPYIVGVHLKRPEYLMDAWRGEKIASFLNQLKEKSRTIDTSLLNQTFSLNKYICDMIPTMRCNNPFVLEKVQPIILYLKQGLFKVYNQLPLCFCHGDVHVLNIVWSKNDILSVIDWEFCGMKIELYDIANFLGCIGIEHPNGLFQDISLSFIHKIFNKNLISSKSAVHLIDCMIALRFAWLSEWLRKKDYEMIFLEITYMNILMNQKDFIVQQWNDFIGEKHFF